MGDGTWDAVASIAIGVLLMAIGTVVNRETESLIVAAGIVVDPALDATGVANAIVEAEARVRAAAPFRTVIYLEPRVRS